MCVLDALQGALILSSLGFSLSLRCSRVFEQYFYILSSSEMMKYAAKLNIHIENGGPSMGGCVLSHQLSRNTYYDCIVVRRRLDLATSVDKMRGRWSNGVMAYVDSRSGMILIHNGRHGEWVKWLKSGYSEAVTWTIRSPGPFKTV